MLTYYELLLKWMEKCLNKYDKCLITIICDNYDYISIDYYNFNKYKEEIKNNLSYYDYFIVSYLKDLELKQSIFKYDYINKIHTRFLRYKIQLEYNKPRYILKFKININNLKLELIKKYNDEDSLLKILGVKFELIENKDYTNLYIYLTTINQKIIEYYNNKNYDYLYDEVKKELLKYDFVDEYSKYISGIFEKKLYNNIKKIKKGLENE